MTVKVKPEGTTSLRILLTHKNMILIFRILYYLLAQKSVLLHA